MAYKQKTQRADEPIKEASPLWDARFQDVETGYYAPKEIPESWKVKQIRERIRVPHIVKEEYGLEKFFHQRSKYYIYGLMGGGGLIADALWRSRNVVEFISGWVMTEGAVLGYVGDYKHQISMKKGGYKARKLFTFADGTKIFADDRATAIEIYKKHHHHKSHPHHFHLFGVGERK
jgi:hypothetical protein